MNLNALLLGVALGFGVSYLAQRAGIYPTRSLGGRTRDSATPYTPPTSGIWT